MRLLGGGMADFALRQLVFQPFDLGFYQAGIVFEV
jgi:hypothetical protein